MKLGEDARSGGESEINVWPFVIWNFACLVGMSSSVSPKFAFAKKTRLNLATGHWTLNETLSHARSRSNTFTRHSHIWRAATYAVNLEFGNLSFIPFSICCHMSERQVRKTKCVWECACLSVCMWHNERVCERVSERVRGRERKQNALSSSQIDFRARPRERRSFDSFASSSSSSFTWSEFFNQNILFQNYFVQKVFWLYRDEVVTTQNHPNDLKTATHGFQETIIRR